MKKTLKSLAIGILLAAMTTLATPALAGITWETRGQAKVGGLILGGTTITTTGAEINTTADQIASYSATVTPATGSNGAKFSFKNAAGSVISGIRSMLAYVSTSTGAPTTAVTSLAALTSGQLVNLATGSVSLATTTATGSLGITTTAAATGSYYVTFVLPNGKLLVSPALVVN